MPTEPTPPQPQSDPPNTYHRRTAQTHPGVSPESAKSVFGVTIDQVLVLYLERPATATVRSCMVLEGALRIQRLEGSRPHGSLCTLNRSERVQRDQDRLSWAVIRWLKGRMERRCGSPRPDVEAGEAGIQGVLAGRDKGSACAPKHGQRPRMWIEVHAAHRSG